jgi:hypothetical protein
MNCEEAYKLLGLQPFEEFAASAIERNFAAATKESDIVEHVGSPLYRGIGATTWMLVNVALHVLHGNNAGVARDFASPAMKLLGLTHLMIRSLLEGLNIHGVQVSPVDSGVFMVSSHCTNTVRCCATSEIHKYPERSTLERKWFIDDVWKARLIRRTQGPYQMIREVRLEEGHFRAYAEDEEFLFEMTACGALEALKNREIQAVGFEKP